jgi:gliding motility-associated-like protein
MRNCLYPNFCIALLILALPLCSSAQLVAGFTANGKNVGYGDTLHVCTGNSISYFSVATGVNSITWKFDNGTSTTQNGFGPFEINYPKAGLYKTIQNVTSASNKKDSMQVFVKVSDKDLNLKAGFTYTPNTNDKCASENYQFTNTSTGNKLTYYWDFGDGTNSAESSPVHQFNTAVGASGTQTFTVRLTVTDANGCSDVISTAITVLKVPDASLTNDPANADFNTVLFNGLETFQKCERLPNYTFIFKNKSSTTSINTTYSIDWGDGTPGETHDNWGLGDTIQHTYTLGLHVITVSVTGKSGCTGTKKYNVFLGSSPGGSFGVANNDLDFCVDSAATFFIKDVENNPPGTIYQIHFDDGSVDSIYQQPPPGAVRHRFTVTSCTNPNGYFTATCFISNPCFTRKIIIPNFYVSGKPSASMQISPDTVACLNTNVTIANTSNFGSISGSNGCSNTGEQVWSIYPATGYTIESGSLGDLHGSETDWERWTNGSPTLNIKFTAVGTYNITLYITNTKCGLDQVTQTICVRNIPEAAFTVDALTQCGSDTVTLKNTSIAGGCSGDSYKWNVTTVQDDCAPTDVPQFVNRTTDSTASPDVWLKKPGKYAIQLQSFALHTGNTCFNKTADTIIIKGKPTVSINTIPAICVNSSITPIATVQDCYSDKEPTYKWTFINASIKDTNVLNPGAILYTKAGLQPVQLSVTNGCGTVTDSTNVNVVENPLANAGADSAFCSGQSITIGAPATLGYTYQWAPAIGLNSTNIADPTVQLSYTGNNADTTYTFIVNTSIGVGCSATDTVNVKVKKGPTVKITSSRLNLCSGDSALLIANGANSYTWSPSPDLNTTLGDSVKAAPLADAQYLVTGTSANGCSDTASINIAVKEGAKAAFSEKFRSGCAPYNLDSTITVTTYPSLNNQYNWYINGHLFDTNNSGAPPSYPFVTEGDSIKVQLITTSLFGCKPDTTSPVTFYTNNALKAKFLLSNKGGCEPDTINITNTSSILDNSINFLWDFGNGITSNEPQPGNIAFNTGVNNRDTVYHISLTASNVCATDTYTDNISLLAKPVARFGVDNSFGCSPLLLSIINTSLGNPKMYYWDFGDGSTTNTSSQVPLQHQYTTNVLDTFTLRLAAENTCGFDTLLLPIVVAPNNIIPQVNVYGNNLYGCAPHSVTFNNNTIGATSSTWDFDDGTGTTLPGNIASITHEYNDTGIYHINVKFTNGCSNASDSQQVTVLSRPKAAFELLDNVHNNFLCLGDSTRINITEQTGDFNRLYWGDDNFYYSPPTYSHLYKKAGIYTIKLYAERVNDIGIVCADSTFKVVNIGAKPIIDVHSDNQIVNCLTPVSQLYASGGVAYNWSPSESLSNSRIASPKATPNESTTYHVQITGSSGCVLEDSVKVVVDFTKGSSKDFVASAFTPNGDGLNDCIHVLKTTVNGLPIQVLEFTIYNRLGQKVFTTNNTGECWDGTTGGQKQPAGAYIYTLLLNSICTNNQTLRLNGTIVLIR